MNHHPRVWKEKDGPIKNMWKGECSCGFRGQFWFWGATLGYMLSHVWKERIRQSAK
jgi:hypothetical protein